MEEFFPDKKGWEKAYEKYWSPDLKATFNATEYDFDGFKEFLATVAYPLMTEGFKGTFVSPRHHLQSQNLFVLHTPMVFD